MHGTTGHGRHHVGVDAEDLVAKLGGKAVHHPDHDNERGHAKAHPEHRDERNDGNKRLLLAGRQVAPGDEEFETHEPGWPSGRSSGKRMTSRMDA